MRGVPCDIKKSLRVNFGDLHAQIGGEGVSGGGIPLTELVMAHPPMIAHRDL